MAGYVYWNVIVICAHDLSIARPICQDNLRSTTSTMGFTFVLLKLNLNSQFSFMISGP